MNLKEIKEILQMMKDFELSELEIEKDGIKIRLKKPDGGMTDDSLMRQMAALRAPLVAGSLPAAAVTAPAAAVPVVDNALAVRSPMVGTFYAAPAPDQQPFVTVGQRVSEGDVLCIIEAMKLMNEIKSEVSGTLTEILVASGKPVEFDQTLFKIRKG